MTDTTHATVETAQPRPILDAGLARSNSLTDLAARIKVEHTAVATALKDSLSHAIAAGALLIEAKEQVPHGQWLPWLREHCTISERTAQLYMRAAKHRDDLEANTQGIADLTLSEAAAVLALSSDARQLFKFVKGLEELDDPEDIIAAAAAANFTVIRTPGYDPFAITTEEEKRDWKLFTLFLSVDLDAGRGGYEPQDAWQHVEWVLQKQFRSVAEWLGSEGRKYRARCGNPEPSEQFGRDWEEFRATHAEWTVDDIEHKSMALQKFLDENEERFEPSRVSRGRRPNRRR
jgi:Protein of unknown function (DUF3102)